MKLFLLRHEEREEYPGFFSNLTRNGLKNAFQLEKILKKKKIDIIYSSPMVRTLQTIFPYCLKNDTSLNAEYALYEYRHNPYFLIEPKIYSLKDIHNSYLQSILNTKYKTLIKKKDFSSSLENEKHLEKRISIFLKSIKKDHKNKTILIVSHKGVLNKIKQLIGENITMDDEFPMGSFEEFTFC